MSSTTSISTPSRSTTNLGLPPRYRGWLRGLVGQWIDQQLGDSDGLPGLLTTHKKLWPETKARGLEETLWTNVVMPQREEDKRGLLQLDWERWIVLAKTRMKTWQVEQAKQRASVDKTPNTPSTKTVKALRRATNSDVEVPSRARLSSSGTPAAFASLMGSTIGTPIKSPGRPPSVASAHSTPRPDNFSDQLAAGLQRTVSGVSSSGSDVDDPMELFCERVRGMKGFQAFDAPVRDEWEVVRDEVPKHVQRSPLPGAFPQSGLLDEEPPSPPVKSAHAINSELTKDCAMLKPIFCLHFPPPPHSTAPSTTSTVRLTRDASGSNVQSNQAWWGSGRRWSEMTLKPGDDLEALSITFVEGKFALPHSGKRTAATGMQREQSSSSIGSSDASLVGVETSDGNGESETDAHSTDKPALQGTNLVIGGGKDDIPNEIDPDTIGLVGGTFIVRGMPDKHERQALERILQRMLYTIQSAVIELSLLDAFRVAKESEPYESPPKADPFEGPRSSFGRPRRDSVERKFGEKKGFLHRLHRDTRGVFGGLFKAPRRNETSREIPEDPLPSLSHRTTPSFDSLGIPPAPIGPVYNGLPNTPDRPYTLGQSTAGTPYVYSSIDTHLELLSNLEQIKMSTTPGLVIPAPILLQRVKKEEDYRHDRVSNGTSSSATGQEGRSDDFGDRPSGNRLGGDLRTGLKGLRSGLDTFEGWTRLQRLDTVRCTAVDEPKQDIEGGAEPPSARVCDKPQTESLVFYDPDSDTSLLDLLHTLKAEMGDMAACTRSGCVATAHDHKRCWYHGEKKVTLHATPREEVEGKPDTALRAWVSCLVCNCASDSKVMTDTAACQSWGKFMELLIYSNIVRPAKLCEHKEVEHLVYHFQTGGISVAISVEAASVLDIRLPRFQVGPGVQKRKAATGALEDTLDALVPPHAAPDQPTPKEVLVNEVREYFRSLQKWCDQLDRDIMFANMTDPEKPRQPTDIQPAERIDAHRNLVTRMRQCELDVIKDVKITPDGVLNEARALFVQRINFYFDEFTQFRKNFEVPGNCDELPLRLPEYYDGKYHALPGSHVVLREDDPASIIAYTLSCLTYLAELTPTKSSSDEDLLERKSSPDSTVNSGWTIEMKRRDNPKDLFALRSLTKKQSGVPATPSKAITAMTVTPTTPSLELSLEQVHGRPEPSDNLSELVKSIHKAAAQDPVLSLKANSPHLVSRPTVESIPEVSQSPTKASRRLTNDTDGLPPPSINLLRSGSSSISSLLLTPNQSDESEEQSKEGWGSVTSSFSNALYRLGSGVGETLGSFRMRGGERSLSSMLGPLSTMSQADNALATSASNQYPHIQFTYALGDNLKLACTVYHAEPFDSLRRRCAIDKELVSSLCNVENWDVSGGKSKALFFRTRDRRFVIKELVTKWTVSDTNAMLELSPAYFEYMQSTFNKATSLIKIVGFYSVTTHDRSSGVKKQMDLLIMEDLFHKQDISRTFDLKGIEGRKVPKANASSATGEAKVVTPETLFDADWLESMARSPILIHPHAKRILTDAIAADTRFLSSQSVMDYSLLLGLDSGRKELVVGIVDSIGSYNLWKTIESRGKLALTRGGEVTVIPPDQYKERFENALHKYFITCPDKWSRTGKRHTGALTSFL